MIVLKRPIITEKSIALYQNEHKATFEVALSADKIQAKDAVEKTFDVTVEKVWTHTRLGKSKMSRVNRIMGRTPHKKVMTFKLKSGNTIEYFEQ